MNKNNNPRGFIYSGGHLPKNLMRRLASLVLSIQNIAKGGHMKDSIRYLLTAVVAALTTITVPGCSMKMLVPDWVPVYFDQVESVFPASEKLDLTAIPGDAYQKRQFNVPYGDLFQIVDVSTSQAFLDVISSNPDSGIILATSSSTRYTTRAIRHVLFYKIAVNELSGSKSEVIVITKEQANCELGNPFWDGCGEWMEKPTYQKHDFGRAEAEKNTSTLFTTVRNNLINAGLL